MPAVAQQTRQDIRGLSHQRLKTFFESHGEKAFRAKQVEEWLWQKGANSFQAMTNLSKATRQLLEDHFWLYPLQVAESQRSNDGTLKVAFALHDGHHVEGVLIPAGDRMTACISSQVGCSLSCSFCATGYMKRMRNLSPGEIFDQVVAIDQLAQNHYQQPLSNVVFMGMGEPLLNYKNLLGGIERLTGTPGLGMSPKRITVSTAGIAKMIDKLAQDNPKVELALSLHAANDAKRDRIMAINETNNLATLKQALKNWTDTARRKVTLEYIVFDQFNDTLQDAADLHRFTQGLPCKINIIEYNPIEQANFRNAQGDRIDAFAHYLEKKGLIVNVRRSRGKDIDAACGQLANKH